MNRISKQIAIGSVAAFLLALSGTGVAGSKESEKLQKEIISGDYPATQGAQVEVKNPVVDKPTSEATNKMLKQQVDDLSGDYPVVQRAEAKQPVIDATDDSSTAAKTEQLLKDSTELIYNPND